MHRFSTFVSLVSIFNCICYFYFVSFYRIVDDGGERQIVEYLHKYAECEIVVFVLALLLEPVSTTNGEVFVVASIEKNL